MRPPVMPSGPMQALPYMAGAGGPSDAAPSVPHDRNLVRLVEHQPRLKGKTFTLVTPFAGKAFAFSNYLKGIDRLPLREAHAIFYDNSNAPAFRNRLLAALRKRFDSWTLLQDSNPHYTAEKTLDYGRIDVRVFNIYRTLLEEHLPDLPLTMIVEDDVELPAGCWAKLRRVLDENPGVATVVGNMNSRRMDGRDSQTAPIVWNIVRSLRIGGDGESRCQAERVWNEKPFGVEVIGSAHTGCWLTRTRAIREAGVHLDREGISFVDQCWGVSLHLAGWQMAIDWSIKTKHFFLERGQKAFV